MKRESLTDYLPTEATIRQVMDRERSEDNRRRALESMRQREASRAAAAAAAAAAAERSGSGRKHGRWLWIAVGCSLAVSAPALVMYWLFVLRGPPAEALERNAALDAPVGPGPAEQVALAMSKAPSVSTAVPSAVVSAQSTALMAAPRVGASAVPGTPHPGLPSRSMHHGAVLPVRGIPAANSPVAPPAPPPLGVEDPEEEIFHRPK